jgi:hypothetical protein
VRNNWCPLRETKPLYSDLIIQVLHRVLVNRMDPNNIGFAEMNQKAMQMVDLILESDPYKNLSEE